MSHTPDLSVTHEGHVALIEICRPPHNFFDFELIHQIANVMEAVSYTHLRAHETG
jgi:enoyl-CoA hydratase/carnithine racemase